MEPKFQSSFIPKQSLGSPTGSSMSRTKVSLFVSIAVVLALIVSALGAGVFIWKKTVLAEIQDMNDDLVAAKEAFNPTLVEELRRLDNRIESAKRLLANHSAVSAVFALLERSTLLSVSYGDFDFSIKDTGEVEVALEGQAKSFTSVALQSDSFADEKFIKNPIFSDINLDDSGNVIFTFASTLDPAVLSYKEQFAGRNETSGSDNFDQPDNSSESFGQPAN